jgi:hypothetical protein
MTHPDDREDRNREVSLRYPEWPPEVILYSRGTGTGALSSESPFECENLERGSHLGVVRGPGLLEGPAGSNRGYPFWNTYGKHPLEHGQPDLE